jgi:hypothetical protein
MGPTGGGGAGGDVFLAGGTALVPQTFTGYNQFNNELDISGNLIFQNIFIIQIMIYIMHITLNLKQQNIILPLL